MCSSIQPTFLFTPDASTAGGGITPIPTPSSVVRTPSLPCKGEVIANVAQTVAARWAANPQISIMWMTQAQFAALATAFATSMSNRRSAGSGRSSKTQTLRNLEREIAKAIGSIKLDIRRKFDANKGDAVAQYSRYGLEKQGRNYALPTERVERLAAIKLIPSALGADGLSGGQYDRNFWANMIANYAAAIAGANVTDSTVSGIVGTKNQQKATLLKAMRSLMLVIQGCYPDTYETMYREWGWQKEDY